MPYKYSIQAAENEAKAVGVALPISTKFAIETCDQLRGKNITKAKKFLENVITLSQPVPLTRFTQDQSHKPGMAAGRYPVKCCQEILGLLKSAEANAQFKGLSTSNLVIKNISVRQGPKVWHMGRLRRRTAKRTHVEVILTEQKVQEKEKKTKSKPAEKPKAAPAKPKPAPQAEEKKVEVDKPKVEKPVGAKVAPEKPKPEVKAEEKK